MIYTKWSVEVTANQCDINGMHYEIPKPKIYIEFAGLGCYSDFL